MSTPKYDSLEIDGLKYKTQLTDKLIHRKQWEKPDPGDCRYEASDAAFIDRGTDRAGDTDLDCDGGIGCRKKESI